MTQKPEPRNVGLKPTKIRHVDTGRGTCSGKTECELKNQHFQANSAAFVCKSSI